MANVQEDAAHNVAAPVAATMQSDDEWQAALTASYAAPPSTQPSSIAKYVSYAFVGITLAAIGAAAPFLIVPWLPRAKFGALPWMPTSPKRCRAMLAALPPTHTSAGRTFLDLGSGDGVAVVEAAKRGMVATGVELNPTLVAMSRWRAKAEGVTSRCTFILGDLWALPLSSYNVIMVFGVIPMMPRLVAKLETEVAPDTYVCSNKFDLPGWSDRRVAEVDGIRIYHWKGGASCTSAEVVHATATAAAVDGGAAPALGAPATAQEASARALPLQ